MEGLAEWNAYDLYFLKIALAVEWEIEYQWRERDPSVWRRLAAEVRKTTVRAGEKLSEAGPILKRALLGLGRVDLRCEQER